MLWLLVETIFAATFDVAEGWTLTEEDDDFTGALLEVEVVKREDVEVEEDVVLLVVLAVAAFTG